MVRKCFLTGELIFFAEERANRPLQLKKTEASITPKEACPFCPENSSMTPKEVFMTEDKKIRIVPNKYPFVSKNDSSHYGIHEVVIDTDKHDEKLYDYSDDHMREVIQAVKNRVIALQNDENIRYVQIFKNDGIEAGASQPHSHWQIAALSVFPPKYEKIKDTLKKYYDKTGNCYFCHLKETIKSQIVEENTHFIAYVPIDSKFPYEMYIIPKEHISNIIYFDNECIHSLGKLIKNCVKRLCTLINGISYNICFYNSEKSTNMEDDLKKYFHFHIQIIPRIGNMAGFEFSTGCYINSVLPETSVKLLKSAFDSPVNDSSSSIKGGNL